MAIRPEVRERVEELTAEVRRLLHGEEGLPASGTKFIDLEDQAAEVGDALTQALLSQVLERQAQQAAARPSACCPHCGRPAEPDAEPEPRLVQTRRGDVTWRETKHTCRRCRRAFFPSEP